jgi:tetratricopeptide (TPR) repeat protein
MNLIINKGLMFLTIVLILSSSVDTIVAQNNFSKAQDLYDAGDYEPAREILEPLRQQREKDTAVRSLLGSVYAKLELWEKAADEVEVLVDKYPDNAEYNFRYGGALGMVAKQANKFTALMMLDDVKFHLKKATRLDEQHINSRWALVQLYVELPSMIGGTKANAMQYADELADISPVDGALARGFVERSEENYREAEKYLKQAVAIGRSVTTYTKLTELYLKIDQSEKAFATLQEGIGQTNAAALKIKFAEMAQEYAKNKDKAIAYLRDINLEKINENQQKQLEVLFAKLRS